MTRSELSDVEDRKAPANVELRSVRAFLEANALHTDRAALRATVALEHHATAAVSLLNPFEMLRWQLLDARGSQLALRQHVPRLLVNGWPREPWTAEGDIRVVGARRGDAELAATELMAHAIVLSPGERIAATFEFDRLADDQPLAAGSYEIGCLMTLIDAEHLDMSRILRAPLVRVVLQHEG